ncbi:hypothetical protein SLOPH_833 [Spraguea lophii 42_110]|uniref:Uncharacterized protein n=1 Tax=Spraguea lophii (strain 42_110) TaxID=1358809 RepID=S7XTS8_SPRLO|nr:hypothetical protein SLOPH_833 [Spraguea lophii 42_110]
MKKSIQNKIDDLISLRKALDDNLDTDYTYLLENKTQEQILEKCMLRLEILNVNKNYKVKVREKIKIVQQGNLKKRIEEIIKNKKIFDDKIYYILTKEKNNKNKKKEKNREIEKLEGFVERKEDEMWSDDKIDELYKILLNKK